MEKALFNILSNTSGVTDLVSTRIYPERADQQEVNPYITYGRVSTSPQDTKTGFVVASGVSKLDEVIADVDSWHKNEIDAKAIALAVRTALDRKAAGTYGGETLDSIQYTGERTFFDDEARMYRHSQEFKFRMKP